eukprot:236819-Amphidinium_carterae.1
MAKALANENPRNKGGLAMLVLHLDFLPHVLHFIVRLAIDASEQTPALDDKMRAPTNAGFIFAKD